MEPVWVWASFTVWLKRAQSFGMLRRIWTGSNQCFMGLVEGLSRWTGLESFRTSLFSSNGPCALPFIFSILVLVGTSGGLLRQGRGYCPLTPWLEWRLPSFHHRFTRNPRTSKTPFFFAPTKRVFCSEGLPRMVFVRKRVRRCFLPSWFSPSYSLGFDG